MVKKEIEKSYLTNTMEIFDYNYGQIYLQVFF